MTLVVESYRRNLVTNDIEEVGEDPQDPFNDLFGPESWRYKVWGSSSLQKLGCIILTSLNSTDIFADSQDLNQLESEIWTIKNNIQQVCTELSIFQDTLTFRLDNALEAIRIARLYENGGVSIG